MKISPIAASALAVLSFAALGCSRLDMQDQPKYRPQRPSQFFADGRSERQPVEGTIARGTLDEDTAFYQGKDAAGKDIEAFPIAVDKKVIERGQQRYDIYCAPCHGLSGRGDGPAAPNLENDWGEPTPPANLTAPLLRCGPGPEDIYRTLVTGLNGTPMPEFLSATTESQRWDLVAWILAARASRSGAAESGR